MLTSVSDLSCVPACSTWGRVVLFAVNNARVFACIAFRVSSDDTNG